MRVVAGVAGGLELAAPRGSATRPITDRVKETLFAIIGDRVVDARVLDLYAGSGAIGIEALSRGAAHATFVERSRDAVAVVRANLARTRLEPAATVVADDVDRFLERLDDARYDLVALDPPYVERAMVAPLRALLPHLEPRALVVLKHHWRSEQPPIDDLPVTRRRRFGETVLTFMEAPNG
jgi:16S rRNA (guanine966-N2)-methyltransferase